MAYDAYYRTPHDTDHNNGGRTLVLVVEFPTTHTHDGNNGNNGSIAA